MIATPTAYFHVRTKTAPKTGLQSRGHITYAILKDAEATDAFFFLLANDAQGRFTREAVALASIESCLADVRTDRPIPAKTFKAAFKKGRSANDPCFLVAAMRNENLLHPAPGAPHKHVLGEDWADWRTAVLSSPGEPFELPDAKRVAATQVSAVTREPVADEAHGSRKGRRPRKDFDAGERHPVVQTEEGGDADPA